MLILALNAILAILTILYCRYLWLFYKGWDQLFPGENRQQPTVSVVLAARNESQHIRACLRSLLDQHYDGQYEVVVTDDNSTDETVQKVAAVARRNAAVRLIRIRSLPSGWTPKKYALSQAIANSHGDIILTTDADCIVPPTWIAGMVRYFQPSVGVVAGLVTLDEPGGRPTLWTRLQKLELFALFAAAAGGMTHGIISASGGNLAYRRETYLSSGGLQALRGLLSGDDDLLVQRMVSETGWKMRFSTDPETIVTTQSHGRLGNFFRQRRRWASKALHQQPRNLLLLLLTFLLNLLLLMVFIVSLAMGRELAMPLVCLALKMLSEVALLNRGARRMGLTGLWPVFPLWELLHVPYIVLVGLAGLRGNLRWKDRRFTGQRGIAPNKGS
jgi:cellulose synthase/poly-beta-1,6-N-acetylglucosamine synthase-like glycosyltransferase